MPVRTILAVVVLMASCLAQTAPSGSGANSTFQDQIQEAKSRIKEMSPEQYQALASSKEKFTLIDVREDSEWAGGRAAGALHISRGTLEKNIESAVPRKNARVILYCHSGNRSALAADTLQKMGYSNVYSLAGGFAAYQKLGLPVEK